MRFIQAMVVAVLAVTVAAPACADVTFHATAGTLEMEVTLAASYIAVDSAKGRLVYDFKTQRRFAIDTANQRYVEYSLFDTVGFRVMEMGRRERLPTPPLSTPQTENELSLLKNGALVTDEKVVGGMREFLVGGVKLAEASSAGTPVSAADAAQFARFMRYVEGGHPQWLDSVQQRGAIPERLNLFIPDGRTVNLAIGAVREVQAPAYDLAPYQRATGVGIDGLFDRIAAATPEQLQALHAAHPCEPAGDFNGDQALDSMLATLECTLSTGVTPPLTPEQKQAVVAAPSMALLFAAIGAKKPNEYADAVKTLVALREQAPRKAYMLKVFEANLRVRMGQGKQAAALFVEALEANPALAGAYKDLGDLLLMGFDTPRAWRSWDAGRRLWPQLPNFAPVNKFESELAAQHPEYF